jgi:hypothetical protein
MHKFYDYEPNWIFNWDTNELINFRLFATRVRVGGEKATALGRGVRKRVELLFAIFICMTWFPYFLNPPDHLANYLEFIWVDPLWESLTCYFSLLSGIIHACTTHTSKYNTRYLYGINSFWGLPVFRLPSFLRLQRRKTIYGFKNNPHILERTYFNL